MSANELDGLMLVPLIAPDGVLACVLVEFRDAPGLTLRLTARAAAELSEGLGKLTATTDWSAYRPTPVPAPEAPTQVTPRAAGEAPRKWIIIKDMDYGSTAELFYVSDDQAIARFLELAKPERSPP